MYQRVEIRRLDRSIPAAAVVTGDAGETRRHSQSDECCVRSIPATTVVAGVAGEAQRLSPSNERVGPRTLAFTEEEFE